MSCGLRQTFGTLGFCFKVVSSSFSIAHVLSSILEFMAKIPKELLLDCGWQHYLDNTNALIDNKLRRFRTMNEAAGHHWSVIEDRLYDHFDENEKQAALLKEMIAYVEQSKAEKPKSGSDSWRGAASALGMGSTLETTKNDDAGRDRSAAEELSPVAMSGFVRSFLLEKPRIVCVLSSVGGDEEHAPAALVAAAMDALRAAFPESQFHGADQLQEVHTMFDTRE